MASVTAPPYDVISPEAQEELYKASPYNVVRLILGRRSARDGLRCNRYTRARYYFTEWLDKGILAQDAKPALYIYKQDYAQDGAKKSRIGFIALMRLEGFSKKGILPHENTFSSPKEDRSNLIRATGANLSPVFSIYQDSRHVVKNTLLSNTRNLKPDIDIFRDGSRHRLWRLTDEKNIAGIQRAMAAKTAFIADGHHRYEAALQFKDEMRKLHHGASGGYDYVMMYFTDMDPGALTILAAHRIIKEIPYTRAEDVIDRLKGHFVIKNLSSGKRLLHWLKISKDSSKQFGLYMDKKAFVIKLKNSGALSELEAGGRSDEWKALDVSILHQLILEKALHISGREGNIAYAQDPKEAIQKVDRSDYRLAFFLNPTKISQVEAIARKKELMPHKSTYFYPKLLSGLVFNQVIQSG